MFDFYLVLSFYLAIRNFDPLGDCLKHFPFDAVPEKPHSSSHDSDFGANYVFHFCLHVSEVSPVSWPKLI